MNLLQKFLARQISKLPNDYFKGMYQYIGTNTPAWVDQSNDAYVTDGYAKNADVFSIVNYIIKRASTIPWKLYSYNQEGELTEVKNHPLIDLMEKPNPMHGQAYFIQLALGYKLVLGNSYIFMPRIENGANKGQSKELWVMPSSKIEIVSKGWMKPVDHYRFMGTTSPQFKPEDVIHLKYINIDCLNTSDLYGMSPLRAGAMALTKSNSAHTAEVKSFQNMAPVGILSKKPNGTGDKPTMTIEQAEYLKNWWRRSKGAENAGDVQITNAQIEFVKMGLSPVDLNILESLKLSFRQLCNLYQFPSQLLNDNDHATYNNIREAKKALYQDVIIPELQSLRDELNRALVPAYGENLWLDIDTSGIDVLQDNKKELVEWLEKAWWMKGTDKQRAMGLTEDPEMDKYFIPTTYMQSDSLGEELDEMVKELTKRGVNDYK